MIRRILATFMATMMPAAGASAWTADCGDKAGAGGARVACACGDTVITNTTLKGGDPMVNTVGPGVGLSIRVDRIVLNCTGRAIRGDPTDDGIRLVDGLAIIGNGNIITRNTTDLNGGDGIVAFGDGNMIDQNRGQANGLSGLEVSGTGNTITRNSFDDNSEVGLLVFADGGTIDRNRGRNNADAGLEVQGIDNTVSNNTFDHNAGWGICLVAGNTDGGGNRAKGNGGGDITFDCP